MTSDKNYLSNVVTNYVMYAFRIPIIANPPGCSPVLGREAVNRRRRIRRRDADIDDVFEDDDWFDMDLDVEELPANNGTNCYPDLRNWSIYSFRWPS